MARNRTRRSTAATLMTGCAFAALLAAMPRAASAQSFKGSPDIVAGDAMVTTGAGSTNVQVNQPETVINWYTFADVVPNAIDFQPAGTTATFVGQQGLNDYTVLNRILPLNGNSEPTAATVSFNGTVNSSLFGGAPGGNILFYSPTGIIVGPTATFNVGSLVLTTDDIQFVPADPNMNNGSIYGSGGVLQFRGAADSKGFVDIRPGAKITADATNSFVALVAPRVQQGGTVSSSGSIGYIGAEQVDLTINAGMFDISILAGTTDANGVVHTGTTTGGASTTYSDRQQITMVAMPKSTALTMLLSGSIGYAPAVNVYDDGSTIVLSAGVAGSPDGNIAIGDASFQNQLNAGATGSILVAPTPGDPGTGAAGGTTSFASYSRLYGVRSVSLTADHGTTISAAQALNAGASDQATGGSVTIEALGASGLSQAGRMTFTGGLFASASTTGEESGTVGGVGQGGSVTLAANGGTITANYISLDATGYGGNGTERGGDGHGGGVIVSAGYGGSITADSASIYAPGRGGDAYDAVSGGDGYGGSIALRDFGTDLGTDTSGGTLALGDLTLNASADGGYTYDSSAGHGGNAFGGTIDIALNRRDQSFGSLNANADAHDGDTSIDPMGGTVNMTVGGGIAVNLASDMYLTANSLSGVNGGPGAIGQGGTVNLTVNDGASLYVSGSFYGQARADVALPYYGSVDSSPDLVGGAVNVLASGATFLARDIYVDVGASNVGADTLAGSATGGTVSLGADSGGSLYTGSIAGVGGVFNLLANAEGSSGVKANSTTGGTVNLFANSGGTVTASGATINITAAAGDDLLASDTTGAGVAAFGGTINLDALGGTIQSGVYADVTGSGGSADGNAGDGVGGEVHVRSLGGTLTGLLDVSAEGNGGQSLVAGNGGDGRGGNLTLMSDADATYAGFELSFLSDAAGGSAAAGVGGDGYGGRAQIDVLGGTHTWAGVSMRGEAYGAPSLGAGSLGGSAFGDPGGLNFHVGGGAALTISNGLTIDASASALDSGGSLVQVTGGKIAVDVDGGAILASSIAGNANAFAGYDPAFGGTARGGSIAFSVGSGSSISGLSLSAQANAHGGSSDGIGGDAFGGTTSVASANGGIAVSTVSLEATADAGSGGISSGLATGGTASLLLDGGTYDWSFAILTTDAHSSYFAGQGSGAIGQTDAIDVSLLNGAALTVGGINLSANSVGTINAPANAVVRGGGINLAVAGGSSLAFGNLSATADAAINSPFNTNGPSTTPDTVGGTITFAADGSALSGRSALLSADAYQLGALDTAGTAQGGTVAVNLLNGSSLTLTSGEGVSGLKLSASGHGAIGDSAGDAFGGSATLTVADSTVNLTGGINVAALGVANDSAIEIPSGSNPVGFDATGGTAAITVSGTAGMTVDSLTVDAHADASTPEFYSSGQSGSGSGYYGGPMYANGGVGTGGSATVNLAGGTVSAANVVATADGTGGRSDASFDPPAFRSGDGHGGTAAVLVGGGTNTITALTVSAAGLGGAGSPTGYAGTTPALAGDGFGGNASLTGSGGTLQAGTFAIDASGYGGAGGDGPDDTSLTPATDGGNGTGGTARLVSTAGGNGTLDLPAFTIKAAGVGGVGGDAALGPDGNGGNGTGGTAATQLADGAFSFGSVILDGKGTGGAGVIGGEGSGGAAQFTLIDSAGPSGARTLGPLSLQASGVSGVSLSGPAAATEAGSTGLDVEVGSAGALAIDGDFEALALGAGAPAGAGFIALTSGAPFQVNGNITINTPRDVAITANAPIFATGGFTSLSRSFTETGLLSAAGFIAITAPQGISAGELRTDNGTTTLLATSGAANVGYLTSFGDVTAQARSIRIADGGRLNVASAQATAGDLFIHTSGILTLQSATATGAMDFAGARVNANSALAPGGAFAASGYDGVTLVSLDSGGAATLTSANGAVSASGDVSSAGALAATGRTGVSFGNLTSGGTTSLASSNGTVAVSRLASAGLVTATGAAVTLQGPGPLSFANAQATAGNLNIVSTGNLTFGQAGASGTVTLTSSGGSIASTGTITAGGAASLSGTTGLSLTTLSSGGATGLSASNGAVEVTNLTSAGAVTAAGRSIDIGSSGALSFANAQASAGNLRVIASGNLAFGQASATGTIAMTSSAGSLSATGPISAGGAVNLFGATRLALGSLTSGGTTLINGGTGALTVTGLTSPGTVTALGRSLDITSSGALTFSSIAANAGAARISTSGNLAIGDGTVTGALTLASANGSIASTGTITAGGAVSLNGRSGLDFNRLNSGGATSLVSANGPVRITRLASAGLVTASGASIEIGSGEALRFDTVASPGAVSISAAGDLVFGTVDAGGNLTLGSTGGSLTASGAVRGGLTQLSSANGIALDSDLAAGGSLGVDTAGAFVVNGSASSDDATIDAEGGITMASLRSGEITRLTANDGNILIGNLDTGGRVSATGLDVDISSSGGLTFDEARATQDNLTIRTGGDLNGQAFYANQDVALTAGGEFGVLGGVLGADISIGSGDVVLGDGARIGERDATRDIAMFSTNPANETFIGGAAQADTYSLDADELTRLFADNGIRIEVPGRGLASDEGHVTVGDLALTFGTGEANIGTGGFFEISTPTQLSIVGNVALTTASSDDRFIIDPARVQLDTDSGSIALLDQGGAPLGQLEVTGGTIAVAAGATLDQLDGMTDLAAINALLDQPGGQADSLRAGSMVFNVGDGLYIQNTGASTAAADRRGFTAGALDIVTGSPTTRISINGVILQNGTPVTGLDTAPLAIVNGAPPTIGGRYDPLSTINGCALGASCIPPPPPDTTPDYAPPPNDELEPPVTPGDPGQGTLSGTLIQLQETQPLINPPLVDEPITGVGNDDLWVPECADAGQEGCPQQGGDK